MTEAEQSTIMIVDDTPANLRLLQEMLRSQGYRVPAFPRGRMALKSAANSPPDLILLDIRMPEMDGFEVCRRLKADDALRAIPVLFISALNDAADKMKAFEVGGVDYVTKPFQAEEVLARVATHLHLHHLQRELARQNQWLEHLVQEKVQEISDSQLATIHALSKLVESRDDDTGDHIERTQTYCRLLATRLQADSGYAKQIDGAFIENIFHASPLHDVGKFGIPDHILLKPGNLTDAEFDIMKTHVTIGDQALRKAQARYPHNAFLNMGIAIARSHHEKWDGCGYPDGLAGEAIPLSARIMALADVYDALRSRRPYKPGFSHAKSLQIIQEGAGSHFDPEVVAAFNAVEAEFARLFELLEDDAAG